MHIFKKIILCIMLISSFMFIKDAKAAEYDTNVTIDWMSNVYANQKKGGVTYYNQMGYIYANGILSYCLEPGKFITENIYHSTTDFSSILTKEQKDYIELLAYYGHGFLYNYREYYMATQELIWEYLTGEDIYFTTESKGKGNIIDTKVSKDNILGFVKNHYIYPSLKNNTFNVQEGTRLTIEDKNHMMWKYDFKTNYRELEKRDNQLYFESEKPGIYHFSMYLKPRNPISFLYYKNDSQTIGSFSLEQTQAFDFTVINEPKARSLKLQKVDAFTGQAIKQENITFKIKDLSTNTYLENGKIYRTNKDGFILVDLINPGTYQVEEINVPGGYYGTLSKVITIDVATEIVEDSFYFTYENEPFRSHIKVKKLGNRIDNIIAGEITYKQKPLEGVTFDLIAKEDIFDGNFLYYKKGDVIEHLKTNEEGEGFSKKLPYGTYCLVETSTHPEFILNQTCEEVILNKPTTNEVEFTTKELFNERASTLLTLYKVGEIFSFEGGNFTYINKPLSNITFSLYAGADIIEDGKILIKKGELIKTVTTNEDGYLVIEGLPYGEYYLKEENLENYEEQELLTFYFDKEHLTQTLNVENKLKKGTIEIIKIDKDTGKPLEGVRIGLFNKNGELVFSGLTDKQGMITIDNLCYGEYYIQEIKSLSNYQLNDQKYFFTLEDEHTSYQLTLTNEKIVYPNTSMATTPVLVSFLKSILVLVLSIGILKRYLF